MKALSFISKNFQTIMIVVLLVALFIALQKCRGEKNKFKELAAQSKSLHQKVLQDSIARAEERKRFEDHAKETEGRRQLAEVEKTEADQKVKQQQKTIDKLVAVIRNEHVPDTSVGDLVQVTPAYKQACDSLPAEIDKLNIVLAEKDTAINDMVRLMDYEIQIRDEEIYKEMKYGDSVLSAYHQQRVLFDAAMRSGKPRGRLLGGLSIMGNKQHLLTGGGPVLAYQTKGGKQYQASAKAIKVPAMERAELFYEGTVLFTIGK